MPHAQIPHNAAMQLLIPKLYRINLTMVNAYVYGDPQKYTLIDTGTPGSFEKIRTQLERVGFALSGLERVLITHAHPDHFGGLSELLAHCDVPVYAHPLEAAAIRGEKMWDLPDPATLSWLGRTIQQSSVRNQKIPPARVDHLLAGGDTLGDFKVIDLPGHAPGQIGLWLEGPRLLIGGDVMAHFLPWLTAPPPMFTPNLTTARASIRKVAEMGISSLVLGHGAPLIGNAGPAVQKLALSLK
jgi:glyoxylase-like metal-dependent hydrolase (beta-lactamase superfamily II)